MTDYEKKLTIQNNTATQAGFTLKALTMCLLWSLQVFYLQVLELRKKKNRFVKACQLPGLKGIDNYLDICKW